MQHCAFSAVTHSICNSLPFDIRLLPKSNTPLFYTSCYKLIFITVLGLGAPLSRFLEGTLYQFSLNEGMDDILGLGFGLYSLCHFLDLTFLTNHSRSVVLVLTPQSTLTSFWAVSSSFFVSFYLSTIPLTLFTLHLNMASSLFNSIYFLLIVILQLWQ